MAEVTFTIAGRAYALACGDGEEERLREMAARVDREATSLAAGGPLPESRLMLMTALLLADKLDEAENNAPAAPEPPDGAFDEEAERIVAAMEEARGRIEALVRKGEPES